MKHIQNSIYDIIVIYNVEYSVAKEILYSLLGE